MKKSDLSSTAPPSGAKLTGTPHAAMKLHSRRLRFLVLLMVSIGFSVAGLKMIQTGDQTGWLVILFFGAGVIVFCLTLLPGSSSLELDAGGFTVCSLFRARRTRWYEVDEFRVARLGTRQSVVFNYSKLHLGPRFARKAAYAIAGCEGALPDTYGFSAEELASMMNDWRRRADVSPACADQANR